MRKIATNELPSGSAGTARWISSLMIPCGTSSGTWWVLIMFECHIHTHTVQTNQTNCAVLSAAGQHRRDSTSGFTVYLFLAVLSVPFVHI